MCGARRTFARVVDGRSRCLSDHTRVHGSFDADAQTLRRASSLIGILELCRLVWSDDVAIIMYHAPCVIAGQLDPAGTLKTA